MNEIIPLADKARRFAEEYLVDFRVGAAADRAGICHQTASKYLDDIRVQALIKEARFRSAGLVDVSVDKVLDGLRAIADASPLDFFEYDSETGKICGIVSRDKMTEDMRAAVKAIKFTKYGPQVEFHDSVAARMAIGKYLGMFVDKHELSGPGGRPLTMITTDMTPRQAAEAYAATLTG